MRTGNELERLTVAEPALLGRTEYLVDASEREQILEAILATDRSSVAGRGRISRSRRTAFVLVGVALAAAAVAVVSVGHGSRPASVSHGPERFRLSGATIQLAGYRFRTPAGFKHSATACAASPAEPRQRVRGSRVRGRRLRRGVPAIAPSNVSGRPAGRNARRRRLVPGVRTSRRTAADDCALYVGLPGIRQATGHGTSALARRD